MTNYSMQRGRKINDLKKRIKVIVYIVLFIAFMVWFMGWQERKDAKLMSIQYCWDSNGEHYVFPDERCVR